MKVPFYIPRRAARLLMIPILGGVIMIQAGAGVKAAGEVGSESSEGTLTLAGSNSYSGGASVVNAGTLTTVTGYYSGGALLASSYLNYQNGGYGVLTLSSGSNISLAGGSEVALTNESLKITPPPFISGYDYPVSGATGLSFSNDITGQVAGTSGSLVLNGTTATLANPAGTLVLAGNITVASAGAPTGATINPSVAGTLTLTNGGKMTTTGSGTLSLGDSSAMVFDSNSTLTLAAGSTATFSYNTVPGLVSSGVTVTLASGSVITNGSGTLTLTNGTIAFGEGAVTILQIGIPIVLPAAAPTPAISGSVNDLKFKTDPDSGKLHVKATVTLINNLDEVLHQVTATVYLSDDAILSSDDITLVTLDLADYAPKGKLGKHKTLSMPLHDKIPSALASYLDGKYLIVDLNATNLDGSAVKQPVVIGPVELP